MNASDLAPEPYVRMRLWEDLPWTVHSAMNTPRFDYAKGGGGSDDGGFGRLGYR